MVPIMNLQNKTLGFGARVIDESMPKYINSSETKVFKKKQILFNERILNKHSNKKIILVEGYFDVIKLYQNNFENCIAPLGTAINHDKLIELTKKGFEVIVCLDGDLAGRNATIRLMNNLLASENYELGIKFVLLPKNYDPDQLVDSNLHDKLSNLIDNPLNIEQLMEKYLDRYNSSQDINDQFKGSKILKSLLETIANKDLKDILNNYFKEKKANTLNKKGISQKKQINQIEFKNDLKSKFSAALLIFYI
jgi:DNA primase